MTAEQIRVRTDELLREIAADGVNEQWPTSKLALSLAVLGIQMLGEIGAQLAEMNAIARGRS